MRCKIMLLIRDTNSLPLYTPYKVKSDDGIIDFETEDENELEETINELRKSNPEKNIFAYSPIPFISETIIGSVDV